MYSKPRGPKRLYYQKISIRIDELENKVGLPFALWCGTVDVIEDSICRSKNKYAGGSARGIFALENTSVSDGRVINGRTWDSIALD